jgi:transposase InsO family protein
MALSGQTAGSPGTAFRPATEPAPTATHYKPRVGICFVHTAIDDYSRVAYAEIHDDEKVVNAAAVLCRAVAWFAERGVTVRAGFSDNGAYEAFLWRDSCGALGIDVKKTGPNRPQTSGKIERLHRTLADAWAYEKLSAQKTSGEPLWKAGFTSTTIAGPTQPSAASHASAWLGITSCCDAPMLRQAGSARLSSRR